MKKNIEHWGYELEIFSDGLAAMDRLKNDDYELVALDWMLPGVSGIDICKAIRENEGELKHYVVFITSKTATEELVEAFEAGADDFISKPIKIEELKARLNVGYRIVTLQKDLTQKIKEKEEALAHVRQLQGLISICSYCHRIRNDEETWEKLEKYITNHSEAKFSHGICPECMEKYFSEYLND
jgi:DNA-binding response OmpR family regulator